MPSMVRDSLRPWWLAWVFGLPGLAWAQATTPGAISLPQPTTRHISIEWAISGDADNDSVVAVRYRPQGQAEWRAALPLRRVPAGSNEGFSWANRHSGSLFDLTPATSYEIELSLSDPDGGAQQQVVSATTRAVPVPGSGALRPATPATLNSVLAAAQPGDIVELGAGSYPGFSINRSGAVGLPLTVRGLPGAVINGELGLFNRQQIILQALTVNGRIRFNGSNDVSILDCTVNASASVGAGDGIVSYLRAERAYIANNTVIGTTTWAEGSFGVNGNNLGEGIAVTGPGHVIAGNRVRGFRDGISFLEGSEAFDQFSIDVIDNTISEAADDGIEADFCFHNCRIVGNRLTNTFIAMSSQPSLGGPTWFVRNRAYNVVHIPFKLYRGSVGDVLLHNTIVKQGDGFNAYPGTPISRAYVRNNLFLGGAAGTFAGFSSGSGRVVDLQSLSADSSLNHNGYGSTLGTFSGRIGASSFSSLAQLRSSVESQAQQVDMSIFANGLAFPAAALTQFSAPTLELVPASPAVDRGELLPNINDGFRGSAPDLGALEALPAEPGAPPGQIFRSGFENPP